MEMVSQALEPSKEVKTWEARGGTGRRGKWHPYFGLLSRNERLNTHRYFYTPYLDKFRSAK